MKNFMTMLIAVLFAGSAAFAQTSTEKIDGPKIKFETTVHDFGENPQGTPVEYEFKFKNVGNEPLVLQSVKASCGCTTPFWPKEPIQPGQESGIKARYNMARAGSFTKTITVTIAPKVETDTPEIIKLTIKGNAAAAAPEKTVDEVKPSIITSPNVD